jgi:uncharacterized protein YaaN involved in tellurite resistance
VYFSSKYQELSAQMETIEELQKKEIDFLKEHIKCLETIIQSGKNNYDAQQQMLDISIPYFLENIDISSE